MQKISDKFKEDIAKVTTLEQLEELRINYLGKKGYITEELKNLANLDPQQKQIVGKEINIIKQNVTETLESYKAKLEQEFLNQKMSQEWVDLTLPTRPEPKGSLHTLTVIMQHISGILKNLGFTPAEGNDIEDSWHNFTALNIPDIHPARTMHDTFYIKDNQSIFSDSKKVLRTHTSPVQIRVMKDKTPPLRIMSMGRTYRADYDATHSPMFHQLECLVVDKGINMGHLKSTLETFLKALFEIDEVVIRLRPSFFPFTEPSAEIDIGCFFEKGKLSFAKANEEDKCEWLEILGCGMVHPNVLRNVGIDPEEYQGFAWGMGIERPAMLKYGISDIRDFYNSDVRWLSHFQDLQ